MLKAGAILMSVVGFSLPAFAEDREPPLPRNTIDCTQFKKTGPQEWIEVGTAVFNLGSIDDIHLTNQPITPRYFKFDGIDLYPVVERKCGAASNSNSNSDPNPGSAAPAAAGPQGGAPQKAEPEQPKSSAELIPAPPPNITLPPPPVKPVASRPLAGSCGERRSVYTADGPAKPDGSKSLVEVVFNNNSANDDIAHLSSEFLIRGYINNELEWSYKGKIEQGNLVFLAAYRQEEHAVPAIFTQVHASRQKALTLALRYIKPTRNGDGDAILYVSGLRALFSSKDIVHRLKFEGKRPADIIPEVFYFERCE